MSPASRRALLVALAFLAVTGTVVAGTAVAAGPQPSPVERTGASTERPVPSADAQTAYAQQDGPTDGNTENGTMIEVTLQGDSDARWTITQHFNVSTPSERTAFEDLAQRFRDGRVSQFGLPSFRRALDRVEPTVNRSMRIHEVSRDVSVEDGTLSLSFTWTNFARERNETRLVGDAFTTAQGTWLNSLGPDQTLIIELPGGSALDTPKEMTDGTLRWDGPASFEPGYLQITYTANPPSGIPTVVWGVALLLVFAVSVLTGGYLLTRRRGGIPVPAMATGQSSDEGESDGSTDGATETEATSEGAEAATTAETDDDDGIDLSLLSDEERVEYLIEENGGRMKQAHIVKETGWSNAKVSQLLSAMEDDDRIAKLRIGRENLISFPDEEIGDFEDN